MATFSLERILQVVPSVGRMPLHQAWFDYDEDADVLYISFERPQRATDSEMADDGVIRRMRGKKLIGVTVLQASRRGKALR